MQFALRPFDASDADWLIAENAAHYARSDGFDDSFGVLVSEIVTDFLSDHDPSREAGWVADDDGTRLGHIFCVQHDAHTAKLRLFFVVPAARGRGVAQGLLDQCLGFARNAGYRGMTLWTHESHKAAGCIYRRNGFSRVDARPAHSFGVDLVEETWTITL
ncbi:GNAT family N-acetyltransferase [Yoonia sp. SS1-5]|uniref:GNAT family N-acetyltransferase n=1 Tax=Yoonia rhodophyticola TaxID=3137370 RepID=A0AAN0MIF9_9RHOB